MAKRRYPHGGRCVAGVLLLITLMAMAAPAGAAELTIDPGAGAIQAGIDSLLGSSTDPSDTLILNPGTYNEHTITIRKNIMIRAADGHGPADTIIDAQQAGRIFDDWGNYALTIDNLTLQNGLAPSGDHGGAIATNSGEVTVTSSTISGCRAGDNSGEVGGFGGAIYSSIGSVMVKSSTITGCRAGVGTIAAGAGGAIHTDSGSVTMISSTIDNCWAFRGGAISSFGGSVTVTSSTITNCRALLWGGAINTDLGGTVRFCRLSGNDASGHADTLGGPFIASDNWWGSNDGPSSGDLDVLATADTWLVLGITASPPAITTAETSTIRANLTFDNNGADRSVAGMVPDGIPVMFVSNDGTLSPAHTATASGAATSMFFPSDSGIITIVAVVDDQGAFTTLDITGPTRPATAIAVDPVSASTVYAGIDNAGIYRTTNSGGSWSPATNQPSNLHIRALVIHPVTHSTLYTGTYGDGVFRSTDSGVNWETCANTGLANRNVLTLVSDSSGQLYAGTEGGVYTSTDGCDTWYAVNGGLP